MDGRQVRVLEQAHQIGLGGLLQGHDGGRPEPQVGFAALGDFPDQPLERESPDQQLGGLLELADLPQGQGSGSAAPRFLDPAAGRRGGLAGRGGLGLGSQAFPRSLPY